MFSKLNIYANNITSHSNLKKLFCILIFLINVYILCGWLIVKGDPTWVLFNKIGNPLKLYTAIYFIMASSFVFLLEMKNKICRLAAFIIKDMLLYFCLLLLGGQLYTYGYAGAKLLSANNSLFYDFPALTTLVNFILVCFIFKFKEEAYPITIQRPRQMFIKVKNFLCGILFLENLSVFLSYVFGLNQIRFFFRLGADIGMACLTCIFFLLFSIILYSDDDYEETKET